VVVCVCVCVCVCVVFERTLGFFPTRHQIKTLDSSCCLFTAFFISLSTTFYIFLRLFVLLVSSLLLSRSHLCYMWLCFAVPCLLICIFLQLFTYSFSTVCISVIFFYYMFIYLFAWRYWKTQRKNASEYSTIYSFLSLNATIFPHVKYFPNSQQFILAT